MKKSIFLFAVVAFFALVVSSNSLAAQELKDVVPTVSVNGSSQVKVTPDEIFMTIRLDESDTKGKVTLEQQRRQMFSALKKCGIDAEKQLSVLDMSSSYFRRRGSLAATQYELKVASADEARRVIEALDAAGVPNVDVTRAASSKIEFYRSEARRQAIQNAKQRATELAEAIGQSIGACYEINDSTAEARNYSTSRVMLTKSVAMADTTVEAAEPEIAFEQIVISYNVSAKFYLNTK